MPNSVACTALPDARRTAAGVAMDWYARSVKSISAGGGTDVATGRVATGKQLTECFALVSCIACKDIVPLGIAQRCKV
jgi:hypothetical protein